ncbi:MAG: SpoIIE family protein phosphatase [Bacteroidales bacterium]
MSQFQSEHRSGAGRGFLFLSLLSFFIQFSTAQKASEKGYFLSIRNYTPRDYKALPQNWSIAEDRRGIIYCANAEGILEYDGTNWRKILMNGNTVKAVASDSSGRIFAGGDDDFGMLVQDVSGKYAFQSFIPLLPKSNDQSFSVHQIVADVSSVFFLSDFCIYRYSDHRIITIEGKYDLQSIFHASGKIFVNIAGVGLHLLKNDSLVPIKGGARFAGINISGILPFEENGFMIVTEQNGFFHLRCIKELQTISVIRHFNEIDNFVHDNKITCAVRLNDEQFALGTNGSGVIIYNQRTDLFDLLNYSANLQDQVIQGLSLDTRGNLWMALNNGISMSPANSAITYFGYLSGLKESVESICRFNGKLYAATYSGLFALTSIQTNAELPEFVINPLYNRPGFAPVKDIAEGCYYLSVFAIDNEKLMMIAGYDTLYQMDEKHRIDGIFACSPTCMIQSTKYPERLIVTTITGVESFVRKNKKWLREELLGEVNDVCQIIAEEENGDFWIGTNEGGNIYKVRMFAPGSGEKPVIQRYGESSGVIDWYTHVLGYKNKMLFGTKDGLMKFSPEENRFTPDSSFPRELTVPSFEIHRIVNGLDGKIWIAAYKEDLDEYEIGVLVPGTNNKWDWIVEPFLGFSNQLIHSIYQEHEGVTWFGGPNGLIRYDELIPKNYKQDYLCILRMIQAGPDSILFNGLFLNKLGIPTPNQPENSEPHLKYQYNSLEFHYSGPNNEDGSPLLYSQFLEGYDVGWSNWNTSPIKAYTNLREGKYIFRLKAKNMYGHESVETTYRFTISPPWYRTVPAIISWVLLSLGFVYFIVALYTKNLRRIIKLRTTEISHQKEELEIKNRDIMDSIKYAQRIQSALLPPGDYLDELFPERFILYLPRDVVSGDFYWLARRDDRIFVVTADCTGHGVPGAMMSMLGMAFLNEMMVREDLQKPHDMLNLLRSQIIESMRQTGQTGESQDGMDMSLFIINTASLVLEFAGAYASLHIFRNNQLHLLKGEKMPLGISAYIHKPFITQTFQLEKGDMIYSFSDGYQDQFGGPNFKRYLIGNLRCLLSEICQKPLEEQREILLQTHNNWKGKEPQVDDILVMGIRV